jgi:hypothetical protein
LLLNFILPNRNLVFLLLSYTFFPRWLILPERHGFFFLLSFISWSNFETPALQVSMTWWQQLAFNMTVRLIGTLTVLCSQRFYWHVK